MSLDPKRLSKLNILNRNGNSFERFHSQEEDEEHDSSSILTLDEEDYKKKQFSSDQQLYSLPTHVSSHKDLLYDSSQTQPSTLARTPYEDSPNHPLRALATVDIVLSQSPGTDESLIETTTANERLRDIVVISDEEGSDLNTDEENSMIDQRRQNVWAERGAAKLVKEIKNEETDKVTETIIKKSVKDFKLGKQLGIGSYSTVQLATDNSTGKQYAVKVLDKRHIIREKKVKYVNIEKNTLHRLGNKDGIIKLFFTFQDEASLYFVLNYASNGELLSLIKEHGSLNEEITRYYSAQILDAISYMHDNGVIHRDLKPENILIDERKRVQVTDFGTAKLLEKNQKTGKYPADTRAKSFVGTAEYVSPELLNEKTIGKSCDIWALGCIIYQMIAGKPPFKATNEYLTFQKIIKLQYAFTAGFPMVVRDLVKRILRLNPNDRLTIKEIEEHHFFNEIDFSNPKESIWSPDPPEAGPYKITARSMLPVPELAGQKSRITISRRAFSSPQTATVMGSTTPKNENESNSPPLESSLLQPTASQKVLMRAKATVAARKKHDQLKSTSEAKRIISTDNAANAALIALSRQSNDIVKALNKEKEALNQKQAHSHALTPIQAHPQSLPSQILPVSASSNVSSRPLRPSNKQFTRTRKNPQQSKPKLSPMTALDIEFKDFLNKIDERVIKKGSLNISLTTVESIEKKFRGKLVDSPLGANSSKSSMLSQVANGSYSGLRNMSQHGDEHEKSVVTNHSTIIDASATSNNEKTKSKFKKFFNVYSSEDEKRNRLLVVTNYGRALLFNQDPDTDELELRTEVHLNHPVIRVKELLPSASSDTLGLFVIETYNTAFLFEAEQGDVSLWTNALHEARESANDKELEQKVAMDPPGAAGTVLGSEAAKSAANIVTLVSSSKGMSLLNPPRSPVPQSPSQFDQLQTPVSTPKPASNLKSTIRANSTPSFISSVFGHSNDDSSIPSDPKGKKSMLKNLVRSRGSINHQREAKKVPESGQLYHGLPLKYNIESIHKPEVPKQSTIPATSNRDLFIAAAEAVLSNDKSNSIPNPSLSNMPTTKAPKVITSMNSRFLARSYDGRKTRK